ncbi:MAG: tetratricopeptide repeat protein [candidate division Zixibacteria bacterium]
MRYHRLLVAIMVALFVIGGTVSAGKGARKLPLSAYIKAAKIEILGAEKAPERFATAEAKLDSLFMWYGPHAEGLFLMNQLMVDLLDKESNLETKSGYIARMTAYADSLRLCCGNSKIKDKYKKNCKKFMSKADSTLVKFWGDHYNAGVNQLNDLKQVLEDMAEESDSSMLADYANQKEALVDSAVANMKMAIILDSSDYRAYVGIASVYEQMPDFAVANSWLEKGLDKTDDRSQLILSIAYNYIKADDYCKAIPYLREQVDLVPDDTGNIGNLAICYQSCDQAEEATLMYHRILSVDPENIEAILAIGRYHQISVKPALDSSRVYHDAENKEKADEWLSIRGQRLDSALAYFRQGFELDSANSDAAYTYGLLSYVQGNFEDAILAYTQAVIVSPDNADAWLNLGDSHLQLKQWALSIEPYEKVAELQPDNKAILERLVDLCKNEKQTEKATRYQKQLDGLN